MGQPSSLARARLCFLPMQCLEPLSSALRLVLSLAFMIPPGLVALALYAWLMRAVGRRYKGVRSAVGASDYKGSQARRFAEAKAGLLCVGVYAVTLYLSVSLSYLLLC